MTTQRFVLGGLLMFSVVCALAQTSSLPASSTSLTQTLPQVVTNGISNATSGINSSLLLSNRTVMIISGLRGIDVSAVKLKFGNLASGRFEIPVAGAKELRREAELLSKGVRDGRRGYRR